MQCAIGGKQLYGRRNWADQISDDIHDHQYGVLLSQCIVSCLYVGVRGFYIPESHYVGFQYSDPYRQYPTVVLRLRI